MKKIPLLITGILVALLVFRYTETGQIVGQIFGYTPLEDIERFVGMEEGNMIRFYFIFNDKLGHDGNVSIVIKDDMDTIVYNSRFDVKAEDFADYEVMTTGEGIGRAYEWGVPYSDIQKGDSSTGYVYMKFITTNGREFNADTHLFDIPSYSEETEELHENEYLQSAKPSGKIMKYNDLKVTLVRYGYYTHRVWDEEVMDFRADVKAENLGNESKTLITYNSALITGNRQYDAGYGSTFDGSNIQPGATREGCLIFKDVPGPEDLEGSGQTILVAGESWPGFNITVVYMFSIQI